MRRRGAWDRRLARHGSGAARQARGGAAIPVTIGDFAAFQVNGRFNLIFVVINTFFGLVTQEAQVQCFRHVAAHLAPGGVFLIEAFVPDSGRFTRGQSLSVTRIDADLVNLDVARHDPLAQRVYSQHLQFTESGTRLFPVQLRYAWPSELDLMARLAGLRLRERWSDWTGAPFTSASTGHISLYEPDSQRD